MEASDCVHGGYYRPGAPQFTQEKKNGGDHFIVEDLLDFSNEEEGDNGTNGRDDGIFETAAGNSTDSSTVTSVESCNSSISGGDQKFSGELCEPYDELAELEWLSNFVEDSFSSEDLQKLHLISGVIKPGLDLGTNSGSSSSETRPVENPMNPTQFFLPEASPFPAKARSKRSRAAPNSWSSRFLVHPPSDLDMDSLLLAPNPVRKTPKPAKKKEPGLLVLDGRKCLHCATDKTPQWRTGPLGPKTLCNACGVRYKSGRLVPEYRPASSPTFVLSKHSNSHRKVMELRRQKEMPTGFGFDGALKGVIKDGDADEFLVHHHLGPQII